MLLSMLLMCPTGVWAAGSGETTTQVPVWLCIPFAGLLLCIAVMPLIKAEWWEAHQPHVVLMWILLMVIRLQWFMVQAKQQRQFLNVL